jgi:N-acetylglucosaminyldiphosphoundecaprenol N-acetyl-beta-D-mannosaminyltransferase
MRILGIRVDDTDLAAALDFIAAAINTHKEDKRLSRLITLNPEGLYLATTDYSFAKTIESADLVTPDGAGVLWAAKLLGQPLSERVTGIDLMQATCERAAREGWRVYLLGAKPGIAEKAAAKLTAHYAGLQICGLYHGYFVGMEDAVIAQINKAAPDILFVALGLPAQEYFCAAHQQQIQAAVAIGVGGSFDVLAGLTKRAPRFMQQAKLEWLWRLMLQPSRLPRMLVIPKFMWMVLRSKKQIRSN